MDGPLHWFLLFGAGAVCGLVNVVAGGGSFLSLPVLMFLGLSPGVANATNRVGILAQNIGAVWGFRRAGVRASGAVRWACVPATLGAALGAWAAVEVSDDAFRRILALLMVGITLWTLWSARRDHRDAPEPHRAHGAAVGAMFFAAGVYGGFVQAGVGFLLLAATTAAGLDLVRGNAIKVLTALCFTALSLVVFAWNGRVEWVTGLLLATGSVTGALVGVRLTVLKGHAWIRRVVTATILVFAVRLWLWE